VRAHPGFGVVVDRAQVQVDALEGAEVTFDQREALVGLTISCRAYSIRVSGLGDTWYSGPLPAVDCKLFDGFTEDDIQWIGGESHITETVGLGGFAQAAAFGLQAYQGGSGLNSPPRFLRGPDRA